jgi:hypothetical protein
MISAYHSQNRCQELVERIAQYPAVILVRSNPLLSVEPPACVEWRAMIGSISW